MQSESRATNCRWCEILPLSENGTYGHYEEERSDGLRGYDWIGAADNCISRILRGIAVVICRISDYGVWWVVGGRLAWIYVGFLRIGRRGLRAWISASIHIVTLEIPVATFLTFYLVWLARIGDWLKSYHVVVIEPPTGAVCHTLALIPLAKKERCRKCYAVRNNYGYDDLAYIISDGVDPLAHLQPQSMVSGSQRFSSPFLPPHMMRHVAIWLVLHMLCINAKPHSKRRTRLHVELPALLDLHHKQTRSSPSIHNKKSFVEYSLLFSIHLSLLLCTERTKPVCSDDWESSSHHPNRLRFDHADNWTQFSSNQICFQKVLSFLNHQNQSHAIHSSSINILSNRILQSAHLSLP